MITIDYKPVMSIDRPSKIVFTDCAESECSYVFMQKDLAPKKRKLVWVQIRNPNFKLNATNDDGDSLNTREVPFPTKTEDRPWGRSADLDPIEDHEDNPYFLFQNWFWVDDILSNEIPVNLKFDNDGDPVLNADGSLDLHPWQGRPGIVKLVLKEHKFVLTRQASLDNCNIIHRLTYIANLYDNLLPARFLNDMDWQSIAEFLSLKKVKLDYDVSNLEYPPVLPHHCMWKHLTLCECLDDLLRNFESRILSVTHDNGMPVPDDYLDLGFDDHFDPYDVVTELKWKRRKPAEYREDINYDKILWPVHNEESEADEENSIIYFNVLNSFFGRSTSLYPDGLYPESINPQTLNRYQNDYSEVRRSTQDFICNLYPYSPDYYPDDFAEIELYLKENHVNMDLDYRFTTTALPIDFYEEGEWSRISVMWENDNYEFFVEHLPRPSWQPAPKFGDAFNAIFKGVVGESVPGGVRMDSLVDMTNNIVMPEGTYLPITLGGIEGNLITAMISGTSWSVIGTVELPDPDEGELIEIKYNGTDVDKLLWTIDGWGTPGTDDMQLADPASIDKVFNYVVEQSETLGVDPSDPYTFGVHEFEVFHSPTGSNIQAGTGAQQLLISFVMAVDSDDRKQAIVDYLLAKSVLADMHPTTQEVQLNMIAERWLYYYERVSITIGLTKDVRNMDMVYLPTDYTYFRVRQGINPDLDPSEFSRYGEIATSFPYTFAAQSIPSPSWGISGELRGGNGMPASLTALKRALYDKVYDHYLRHSVTLSI